MASHHITTLATWALAGAMSAVWVARDIPISARHRVLWITTTQGCG